MKKTNIFTLLFLTLSMANTQIAAPSFLETVRSMDREDMGGILVGSVGIAYGTTMTRECWRLRDAFSSVPRNLPIATRIAKHSCNGALRFGLFSIASLGGFAPIALGTAIIGLVYTGAKDTIKYGLR